MALCIRYPHSAISPWRKRKLQRSGGCVNTVAGLLTVRIDVGKPADATTGDEFEKLAVVVEELIISLFISDASHRRRALGLDIRNPLIS